MDALLRGRLVASDRLLNGAGSELEDRIARAWLLREQDRPAEAELELRDGLADDPDPPPLARAVLTLVVAEMGRDTQANPELSRLMAERQAGEVPIMALLAEIAANLDAFAEADELYEELRHHAGQPALDPHTGIGLGVVDLQLGRLAHCLGRGRVAAGHYDAAIDHLGRSGMGLLAAHARRHLATVLRIWGADDDWARSLELLSQAADTYRRLGLPGRAAEAHLVLGRSDDPLLHTGRAATLQRRGQSWSVGSGANLARVPHSPGLEDLTRLVAIPRTAVHVMDLLAGLDARTNRSGTDRPWFWPQQPRVTPDHDTPVLDPATAQRYTRSCDELSRREIACRDAGDQLGRFLARAELEVLTREVEVLSGETLPGDPVGRASVVVGTRVRLALDDICDVAPAIGRHLRYAVRTGTFCSYEPEVDMTWKL